MTPTELNLEEEIVHGVTVINARGEIDRATAPHLSDALRRATFERGGAVLVDLCDVSFIDSSAISVLLNALRRLTRNGRRLLLACPPSNVLRVFELTGLSATFDIFTDRDEALAEAR